MKECSFVSALVATRAEEKGGKKMKVKELKQLSELTSIKITLNHEYDEVFYPAEHFSFAVSKKENWRDAENTKWADVGEFVKSRGNRKVLHIA